MQWEREVIIIRLVSLQCNKTEIEWSLQLIRASFFLFNQCGERKTKATTDYV